jgi:hypothetical protein
VCFIFETVDEVAASTFVWNVLVEFARNNGYYPHDVGTEIPQNKLGNSWGYLTELVAQATGETGTVHYDPGPEGASGIATVRGLTDDVLTLVREHAKGTGKKVAQEALALEFLARDDLKELLKVWSGMKEEHKKRKCKGETLQTLQCCRFDRRQRSIHRDPSRSLRVWL